MKMKNLIYLFIPLLLMLGLFTLSIERTSAQTFGTNWQAQFYNNISFTDPVVATASYPNGLNLNWQTVPTDGNNNPLGAVQQDNFSVRFTSSQFFNAGIYDFTMTIDDQATVLIGGVPVTQPTVPGTYTFSASFTSANNYSVEVRLVEISQVAIMQLQWVQQGAVGGTPGAPTATPGPVGPQGNVVNVRGLALRTGPYLGASYVSVLRPDIAYQVLARNEDEGGGYTWYRVNTGEREGWTSGRYLTVTNGTPPLEGSVFDNLSNPPDIGVVAVTRAIMNFRRRPSIRSARIADLPQIPWGAEAQLVGRTVQGGRNFWFLVRYEGRVGWIYAPYVSVRGNLNSVPVY
ncbi:MAG: hypothetical protein RLP44_31935 [Aggregatilineales bacterium]